MCRMWSFSGKIWPPHLLNVFVFMLALFEGQLRWARSSTSSRFIVLVFFLPAISLSLFFEHEKASVEPVGFNRSYGGSASDYCQM